MKKCILFLALFVMVLLFASCNNEKNATVQATNVNDFQVYVYIELSGKWLEPGQSTYFTVRWAGLKEFQTFLDYYKEGEQDNIQEKLLTLKNGDSLKVDLTFPAS